MFETVSYTEAILVGVLAVWFGITVLVQCWQPPMVWRTDVLSIVPR